jgi:hypothetical protein
MGHAEHAADDGLLARIGGWATASWTTATAE